MSVLQQVLTDARKLATRLRDHDSSADSLLSQAQGMFKQVESMKEYCEEMNELNEAANNRPRSALIHSIQQENKHIRQLQQENKELRLALEEHQNVMELIMSKYRQQVAQLVTVNAQPTQPSTQEQAKLAAQIERVSEMVAVMRQAASLSDDECNEQQKLITALATENKGLREMLNIASRSGSLQPRTSAVDAGTQTGQDSPKPEEGSSQDPQEDQSASLDSHKTSVS
ncbi:FGFR1 oncogene partner 2 homolog isoform X4 [Eriocheir sinensis]|nr:FGFR1 oncogene partner 2 homolog isoform X4 [Eriocheir sinensis]